VKKVLTYTLILGFVVVGANPLSFCAIVSSALSDCASSETRSQCDKMDMGEHPASAVAPRSSFCCVISQAPLPESKTEVSKTTVKLELAAALTLGTDVVHSEKLSPPSVPQELSPPPLRSLLCTFLI
jgi:hypothetical protein